MEKMENFHFLQKPWKFTNFQSKAPENKTNKKKKKKKKKKKRLSKLKKSRVHSL